MSTGLTVAVLVGCVALIGAVFAVYKRSGKVEEQTPAGAAKP